METGYLQYLHEMQSVIYFVCVCVSARRGPADNLQLNRRDNSNIGKEDSSLKADH